MDIVVTNQITPTFTPVGPLCQNSTPAALPTTSTNNISGTWSPALSTSTTGTATYTFTAAAGQCATTATMDIVVTNQITPTFTQVGPLCQNSTPAALPTTSTNNISGTWSPALSTATTGTATYTFTAAAGQCATTATMDIVVTNQITPAFTQIGPLCQNSAAPSLPATSTNGINGTWSPATINTTAVGTTTYTFTATAGQCATTATMDVVITNQITPAFTQIGPLCQNSAAPSLPATSTNGINGTWSPATINTTAVGTTTYTFTATAGQCATTATMDVVITNQITPAFTQIGPLCQNSAAPSLPATSTNGINGTWRPATINTTAVGTTTYTFTATAGQCATTATMDVVITNQITPAFTQIGPLCQNSAAPSLPATSTNGINGTWSPATINTTAVGTTTYTFTATAGQCATTATMDVVITNQITPAFTQIGPLCQNSAAPSLPATSTNGINGTWSPATINTTAVGTTTYTFTATAGQCATTATLTITVNSNTAPTFNPVAAICSGAALSALPTTSLDGITGTWSPALDNTTTTLYTFTPTAGQCATTATLTITVNSNTTPTFNPVAAICSGAVLSALPTTSLDGITGTWSPALDNTTTTLYTFTPTAGQCATTATLTITVNSNTAPTFNAVAPICSGAALSALPTTSLNGITGTWSPALDNTTTTLYTFTATAGQCATTATMDVVITNQITPAFTQIGSLCQNSAAPSLPATSTNGINGTWSPATINTTAVGTTTYTFTATAGQCATTATMDVVITNQITPAFTQIGPLCQNSAAPSLPATSTNGINGTWSPATINTSAVGTTTYTFTAAAGQCATTATMDVVITAKPIADAPANVTSCASYTLPALVNGTSVSYTHLRA